MRISLSGLCWCLILLLILCRAPASAFLWGPYITGTDTTTATVNWRTASPSTGSVSIISETGECLSTTEVPEACLHRCTLTGLEPGSLCRYRVESGGEASPESAFMTFPENGSFTFVVYGDTQEQLPLFTQTERHRFVAERIAAERPLFVLHTGDLVCDVKNSEEWERFFESGRELLANTTLYTTLGNHEKNASLYYETTGYPEWYSFRCGSALFTVLDSNDNAFPSLCEQTAWLSDELGKPAVWRFAAFHHPSYSSGTCHPGGWKMIRNAWEETFVNRSVNAVFSGHVHTYERFRNHGVDYFVTGTGGGGLYTLSDEKAEGHQKSCEHTLGYLRVSLDGDSGRATAEFVKVAAVSEDNTRILDAYEPDTVYDSFVITPGNQDWLIRLSYRISNGNPFTMNALINYN